MKKQLLIVAIIGCCGLAFNTLPRGGGGGFGGGHSFGGGGGGRSYGGGHAYSGGHGYHAASGHAISHAGHPGGMHHATGAAHTGHIAAHDHFGHGDQRVGNHINWAGHNWAINRNAWGWWGAYWAAFPLWWTAWWFWGGPYGYFYDDSDDSYQTVTVSDDFKACWQPCYDQCKSDDEQANVTCSQNCSKDCVDSENKASELTDEDRDLLRDFEEQAQLEEDLEQLKGEQ